MKNFLINKQRNIIFIISLAGILITVYDIYLRIVFAFSQNQNIIAELKTLPILLLILMPALLGIFYFYKKDNNFILPFSYIIYGFALILTIVTKMISTDALEEGLTMLLIVLPICFVVCIILLLQLFRNKVFNTKQ